MGKLPLHLDNQEIGVVGDDTRQHGVQCLAHNNPIILRGAIGQSATAQLQFAVVCKHMKQ